ncbi:MAG TPA: flagellin [Bryobacteraceae bacterium]|nr:flagellin [Bryobacteraceae bacterium]
MSFSINTNVASLQAQNYLRVNSDFQSKTINRVTSGLRIVQSGDDAAGLAIANGYRSDESVLTQGVRNANDGLSQLQIIDGGISNISQLLDRARTLATQSASGTFTGDRSVLNGEFQNVLSEINRQATSIGLNQGGIFAKNLSVFVGGGRGATTAAVQSNGSVGVDLSHATVDTQSLGLSGYGYQTSAIGAGFFTTYGGPGGGTTTLNFQGAGFSDTNSIPVSVNLQGIGDINSLVTAINAGIQGAAQGGTPQSADFKAANIVASADSSGHINFTSSTNAFMVTDNGTAASQNLLSGASAPVFGYAQGTYRNNATSLAFVTMVANDAQKLTFSADSNGTLQKVDVTLGGATTQAQALTAINTALQNSNLASLQGIVAVSDGAGTIGFASPKAFNVTVGSETLSTGATDNKGFTIAPQTLTATIPGSDTITFNSAIDSAANAQNAVSALATAVSSLGSAQAVVGRGQNQFSYAINLAQSQLTNLTTAESRVRDADLAAEAANLTKAQILLQAGVAALAQANSAPQQVLSLLKGQ